MSNPGGLIFTIISCMSFTILLALCIKRLRRSVTAANSRSREDLAASQEFPIPATIVITLPLPEYAVDNAAQSLGRTKQDGGLDEAAIAATGKVAQFSELRAGGAGGGEGKSAEEGALGEAMRDCAVCLVEFDDKDTVRVLSACSHSFHQDCIDAWLRSHTSCPLCRTDLAGAATSAV